MFGLAFKQFFEQGSMPILKFGLCQFIQFSHQSILENHKPSFKTSI